MRRLTRQRFIGAALVLSVLSVVSHHAVADPQSAKTSAASTQDPKDRDRLKQEVDDLRRAGKYAEAASAAERLLVVEEHLYGKENWHTADARRGVEYTTTLRGLNADQLKSLRAADERAAEVAKLEMQQKFKEAIGPATQVVELRKAVLGPKHWRVADALHALGRLYVVSQQWANACAANEEALTIRRESLGENHPDTGRSWFNLGQALSSPKELPRAQEAIQKAVSIWQLTLGDEDRLTCLGFGGLAEILTRQHNLIGARESFTKLLAIRRKVLPKNHSDITESLNKLGLVQWRLHDYAAAQKSHEEALAIRRKVLPKEHADIARSLINLALVQEAVRDYASARKSHEEALGILRKVLSKDDSEIALCLSNLGNVQRLLRDYASARKNLEEAWDIYRKAFPMGHADSAASLNNLGLVQQELRDYTSARRSLEGALNIYRKVLPEDDPRITLCLNNLAVVQGTMRDYASARKSHEEVLDIRRKALAVDDPRIAQSLNNLGLVQRELRDYASARRSLEGALNIYRKILPKEHPDIAMSLNNLGLVQWALRDDASARKSLEEALAVRRKVLPMDDPDIALTLNNLGNVQAALRDYASARKSHEEALAICRKVLPVDHPYIALSLNNLGLVQEDLHDYASARKSHQEALDIYRKALPMDYPDIARSLNNLGRSVLEAGAIVREDLLRFDEATDIYQRDQLRMALLQAEQEQLVTATLSHWSFSLLLSAALATKGDLDPIYDRLLHVKGGVTAQQRWARQARDNADPETKRLLVRLRQVNGQLLDLSTADRPASQTQRPKDVRALTESLSSERARLERQLSEQSQTYRTFRAKARIDTTQIRAALPAESALIDLIDYDHVGPPADGRHDPIYEDRLLAFVVRPEQKSVVAVPLGSTADLAELIDRWRASYGSGKVPIKGAPDPAQDLRKRLWEPLSKHLAGVKTVLISPDGPLNGLPWAALPGSKVGTFLVQDYAFSVVPVPQLLPELLRAGPGKTKEAPSVLLAGGIDFGESVRETGKRNGTLPSVPVFAQLNGSESEVNDLRTQFEDAFPNGPAPKVVRKDRATKQEVLALATSYRFMHLATHGFFADESEKSVLSMDNRASISRGGFPQRSEVTGRNPGLLSGLVFAGVNLPDRRPEETILTALEASELDLHKTELLVLSACETGRGQVAGGEGVLGLQRAFQLAGARSVVASLWRVPDEETHQLMREFYRRVWSDKHVSKAEALRQAQIWMLKNWKPRGLDLEEAGAKRPTGPPPPFFWAAFVLSGDWR